MPWTRIPAIFLFAFGILHGGAHVLPPTNVSLDCHNLKNILHWNYEQLSPQIQFRVDVLAVRSTPQQLLVNWPTLHADLSSVTFPDDEYFVTITAIDGQNKSEVVPVDGITFSYLENSLTQQKCVVDLPSVNVTVQPDHNVEFRFPHPWLLYRQKLSINKIHRKKKSHDANIRKLPKFSYAVVIVNQKEISHGFSCMESVCEGKLPVDGGQEPHCLRINGHLENVVEQKMHVQKMAVRATQDYCTPVSQKTDYVFIAYIVVGLLVFGVIGLILFMVYRKQTHVSSSLPSAMKITGHLKNRIMKESHLPPEQFAVPEVLLSPTETQLLPLTESEESTPGNTPSPEYNVRLPIGVASQDERVPDEVEVRGEDAEGYMQGRELDDDVAETENNNEDCGSGYEKRELVVTVVEVAPGDRATGYHG